jgi:hypothetical protein
MISPRYAAAVCLLIAGALVPTVIHSYAGLTSSDGRAVQAIPRTLAGFTSTPSGRNESWGKRRFGSDDWIERRYVQDADAVMLTVVRSYDLKTLYHHPELAVTDSTPFTRYETARFPEQPSIPVHVLRSDNPAGPIAMYVLHYDDRYVEHPISFQLRTAGELLVRGRKAMTLFFVLREKNGPGGVPHVDAAARVLFDAIHQFTEQRPDR